MTHPKVEPKIESGEGKLASLPRATLVERRDVTDDLMVIKLVPDDGVFEFKPGQYCTLGKEGVERAYSIASAPHQDFLEVFVELVPDGELTPKMWRLNNGDTMSVRPRGKGVFTFKENFHHHLMLSTVTGVSPTISMIPITCMRTGKRTRFTCCWAPAIVMNLPMTGNCLNWRSSIQTPSSSCLFAAVPTKLATQAGLAPRAGLIRYLSDTRVSLASPKTTPSSMLAVIPA